MGHRAAIPRARLSRCTSRTNEPTLRSEGPFRNLCGFPSTPCFPMKRTYQPKVRRRKRRHGFRHRMRTRAGRATIKNRRQKGRKRIAA